MKDYGERRGADSRVSTFEQELVAVQTQASACARQLRETDDDGLRYLLAERLASLGSVVLPDLREIIDDPGSTPYTRFLAENIIAAVERALRPKASGPAGGPRFHYATPLHEMGGPVPDAYWEIYRDLPTFTAEEIVRPAVRRGPILVGPCTGPVRTGARLQQRFGPWPAVTVLAVEAAPSQTTGSLEEPRRLAPAADADRLALVVDIDGPQHWLVAGLEFDVLPSTDLLDLFREHSSAS